jgi:2-dehydropantoate 2-reductase
MTVPSENGPLRVLTFGAGAIGTYVGGSLALAGHRLTFVERPHVVEELRQRGLRLDLTVDKRRAGGVIQVDPSDLVAVGSLKDALRYGPFDVVIFALKSFDTAAALENIKPYAEQIPPILCLQNGVENEPLLAATLGQDKVLYGTLTCSVGRRGPGDIVLERSRGLGVAVAEQGQKDLAGSLVVALNGAGLNARLYPNPADMKWSKLLTNLTANATSAILDMTPTEIFAHPDLYRLEMRQLREALAVMKAMHIQVIDLPRTPVRLLAWVAYLPDFLRPLVARTIGGGRGGKMPSFHIDLHSGRRQSEVDWLNGAVVRAGERMGIATPVNQLLSQTLTTLIKKKLALDKFSHHPGALVALLS